MLLEEERLRVKQERAASAEWQRAGGGRQEGRRRDQGLPRVAAHGAVQGAAHAGGGGWIAAVNARIAKELEAVRADSQAETEEIRRGARGEAEERSAFYRARRRRSGIRWG